MAPCFYEWDIQPITAHACRTFSSSPRHSLPSLLHAIFSLGIKRVGEKVEIEDLESSLLRSLSPKQAPLISCRRRLGLFFMSD